MYSVHVAGGLVKVIAERIHGWFDYHDIQLQTLAVKIVSELSLVETQRIAIAETGILNTIFGRFLPDWVMNKTSLLTIERYSAKMLHCQMSLTYCCFETFRDLVELIRINIHIIMKLCCCIFAYAIVNCSKHIPACLLFTGFSMPFINVPTEIQLCLVSV